ncbi:DUF6289 family protein [Luteibacter sp. PPL201]|uniref:DUF6289 family protein n=1 Tax=Luteibacter sahnii TaxID=3021977 RepID=A0ABT6B9L6_9GAMM|nr:DUF6289 family protein [Luteibacter sp. PPL193]MDY1546761.1 DUF6289 family protein [Luteibacter sp. PPL193]
MTTTLKSSAMVAVLVGVGGLMGSGAAMATRPGGTYVNNTYYSDATKTQIVGVRNYDCAGRLTQWGTQTNYQSFNGGECDAGAPGAQLDPIEIIKVCPVTYDPYPVVTC